MGGGGPTRRKRGSPKRRCPRSYASRLPLCWSLTPGWLTLKLPNCFTFHTHNEPPAWPKFQYGSCPRSRAHPRLAQLVLLLVAAAVLWSALHGGHLGIVLTQVPHFPAHWPHKTWTKMPTAGAAAPGRAETAARVARRHNARASGAMAPRRQR